MNNFIKIVVAGSIATMLQRSIGLNPISLEGFAFFIVVFIIISFVWQLFFSKEDSEKREKVKKPINYKKFILALKKPIYIVVSLLLLNSAINIISFKTGLFDDEFRYRFDTKKAIALNLKEDYLKSFTIDQFHYYLYQHGEKYFLVKRTTETKKNKILTLYSKVYMFNIYRQLKNEKDFLDILKNISPTVYEEVSTMDMILKPLWYSNTIEYIYWTSEDYKKYKEKYIKYFTKQKRLEKENNYKKLLNMDLKNLDEEELSKTIKKLYSYYAFTKDTRYALSLFDELGKKSTKFKDKELYDYQMQLLSYLYLFRTKEKLNDILKQYKFGVVYTFSFWDRQPLDIPKQKNSHLRLVDLNKDKRFLLWQSKIKKIEGLQDKLIINLNNGKKLEFTTFKQKDIKTIGLKLNAMIRTIYAIEKKFKALK